MGSEMCIRDRILDSLVDESILASTKKILYGEQAWRALDTVTSHLLASSDSGASHSIALEYIPFIKDSAFEDEREYRLVVRDQSCHPSAKVRVSPDGNLISYLPISLPASALRSITCPPGADAVATRRALNHLLGDGGRGEWSHVEIRHSKAVFRW